MIRRFGPEWLFSQEGNYALIDVRSPLEFVKGHIPGAANIPLFTDEERAVVGTRYHDAGKDAALLIGLDFAGVKMSDFVKRLTSLTRGKNRKVAVYCWRGGMRSASMSWLFSTAGFDTVVLEGGYKAYRTYIREAAGKGVPIRVLGGMTGSGKTEVLGIMQQKGCQVIDLEHLAHHKGSVFGSLGQKAQPSNEQFENDLYNEWRLLDHSRPVWVEDESRSIGTVSLPPPFFDMMKKSPMILLRIPAEIRVRRLVREYACFSNAELLAGLDKIAASLGGQTAAAIRQHIGGENYEEAIRLVLGYYDKTYLKALERFSDREIITLDRGTGDADANAQAVMNLASVR
jgi:tRNA 2-selenouridine synthase